MAFKKAALIFGRDRAELGIGETLESDCVINFVRTPTFDDIPTPWNPMIVRASPTEVITALEAALIVLKRESGIASTPRARLPSISESDLKGIRPKLSELADSPAVTVPPDLEKMPGYEPPPQEEQGVNGER